eukprot:140677-Prymnesium_polylepis.1
MCIRDSPTPGEGWGIPMGPRGKGGFPRGLGRACVRVRLYSFAVERVILTTNQEESTTNEGGLRNEDMLEVEDAVCVLPSMCVER